MAVKGGLAGLGRPAGLCPACGIELQDKVGAIHAADLVDVFDLGGGGPVSKIVV